MAIPSRQIGGSTKSNLLWQISKQLEHLICVRSCGCGSTTTTTSTAIPTTSTTTTGEVFPIQYCVWSSTDYEIPQISGYNVATNTLVPVPIDNNLTGITSMCTTSTKLWKHDPSTSTIREWFINSYPASLTFNRNITYQDQTNYVNSPIITAVDNNTILTTLNAKNATFPNGIPGSVSVFKYDISTNNAGYSINLFGITAAYYATAMMFTTDSKLIVSAYRLIDNVPVYYLTQYSYPDGLKEVDISLASIPFNPLASSSAIYPITYNGEIYLIRSNDSSLFKIDTTYPYAITEVTANLGFQQNRTFESSAGECNNVSFTPQVPICGTTIPNVGETFTYFGVTGTVTTLSGGITAYPFLSPGYYAQCSGMWQPPFYWVANGAPATIVLTFDSPINNVGLVFSILDLGDNFTITTNTEVPSLTMSTSCYATVSGNQIITGPSPVGVTGSGQFVINTTTPYTVLTIVATNGGAGGPIGLSCDPCCSLPDVTIGTQIWTGCNLNVETYQNGDAIPQVQDPTEWPNLTTGAWCYYNNDPLNGCTYGKMYNWYAINDPRGLAPTGYHIPSETEVLTLQSYLGGQLVAGGKMKETGLLHWNSPNTGATNSSGFTALAGGSLVNGQFGGTGISAPFWMTDSSTPTMAYYMDLYNFNSILDIKIFDKVSGHYVRLISDTPATTTSTTTLAPSGFNTIYTHFESL